MDPDRNIGVDEVAHGSRDSILTRFAGEDSSRLGIRCTPTAPANRLLLVRNGFWNIRSVFGVP